MHTKEYELIAKALKDAKPPVDEYERLKQWNITVEMVVYDLTKADHKFNALQFNKAAGYGWNESLEPEASKAHRFDPKDIRIIR